MIREFIEDWRSHPQLGALLLILLAVPAVFYATTASMADIWVTNETFTHGFLILPISLWLIWGQRDAIATIAMQRDLRALIFVVPTLLLWLLATAIDVAVVQQLTMVALIPLSVWLLLGLPLALALLFPLLYLFFAVPLGQALIPPMMELTADVTVALVQHSGIPIYRDGLTFELPTGRWSVVEECSGVRYLIASAALGTIYAYITYRSFKKRTLFIIASLIVPIVANGLRAYGIVMIGHWSGMQYAVGADHLLYGWVFFGLVIFVLFWIGGFWADGPETPTDLVREAPTDKSTVASLEDSRASGNTLFRGILGAIATLLLLNLGAAALKNGSSTLAEDALLSLPEQADEWRQIDTNEQATWAPIFYNPDRSADIAYAAGDSQVTLHVGYFHTQRDDAEAVSSLNRLSNPYDGAWNLTSQRSVSSTSGTVTESELSFGSRKIIVWSTYLLGDRFVANPYIAKLVQAQQLLTGQRHGAFIALAAPYAGSADTLYPTLDSAWNALMPRVAERLSDLATP